VIFRDEKNARQTLSTEDTAGKPVGFGMEAFNAAWGEVRREEQSVSMDRAFGDRFGTYIDEVEKLTGTRLESPIQPRSNFSPADLVFHGGKRGARQHDYGAFLEQVDELRAGRDDIPDPPDPEAMLDEIITDADIKRRELADLRSRRTTGGKVADFLGASVGTLEDPMIAATLPFGASASSGILRTALTEAGISMAVDAPIQFGTVMETKDVLGVDFDAGDAAINVLMAGAVAGGIGGTLKGAGKGVTAIRNKIRSPETEPEVRRRRPTRRAGEVATETAEDAQPLDDGSAAPSRAEGGGDVSDSAYAKKTRGEMARVQKENAAKAQDLKAQIASDRKVLDEYRAKVDSGEVKETPATKRAADDLDRDLDIAESNPYERSRESDIEHEENFNKAYEALQRGTTMSVPMRSASGKAKAATSGDDAIAEIMSETDLPKPIQARFHDAIAETRTQVSVSAPKVFSHLDDYRDLVQRQDKLLATPRTKKNRAKLNKEIAKIANQLDELQRPEVVASASRDRSVDEFWRADRPADEISEEVADQALKADLKRAVDDHGDQLEIPLGEAIDEASGLRVAGTKPLREVLDELDEADQLADEVASCLLGTAEVAA